MAIPDETKTARHTMILEQREKLSLTGVLDVISFDEDVVVAETELGILILKGINLHVSKLNLEKGDLDVDGEINSIVYEEKGRVGERNSFFGKIFR